MDKHRMAIIPARSGSKGIKDKNIHLLNGVPLMAYSIRAAIDSNIFESIIVSTDSPIYAGIAKEYGADVMMRDPELATDDATTYDVIKNILNQISGHLDYFVLLQPTSPLRNYKHVQEACELFDLNMDKYHFLVSVKEAEHIGALVKPIDSDNSLKYFDTDFSSYKRQNAVEYSPNGAIFIGKQKEYLEQKHFFGAKSLAYKMGQCESVDIDNELDFVIAEACLQYMI